MLSESGRFFSLDPYSPKTHILIYVVLGILLYWYTLPYPLVFDSRFYLVNIPLIADIDSFLALFNIPDFADDYSELGVHRDVLVTFILRPFANFTFYLHHLIGSFHPGSLRSVNIVIHISNAVLWYTLLRMIIHHRGGGDNPGQQWLIPFFSALFFLVHPLSTESVTYVIQRYASLGTLFYLVTMLLFMVSLLNPSPRKQRAAYIGSIISLFTGLMVKENLVTAPFTLILMSTVLLQFPIRKILVRVLPHICCLPIIPFVVYLVSSAQLGNQQSLLKMHEIVVGYPPYEYIITQARVVLTYLRMLIAPYGQSLDPDYPLYQSIANPEIIAALIILLLFITAGVLLQLRKEKRFSDDLLSFCVFFSLLSVSVASFFPLPDLMTEHRSYLFSLPAITGLVCRIDSIRTQMNPRWAARIIVFLVAMTMVYSALTVKRNLLYSSRSSIWEDALSKGQDKWRTFYNAGCANVDEQHYEKALSYFQRAIEIEPLNTVGYSNLGSTYISLGDYYSAIEIYHKGLAVKEDEPVLLVNLGSAYWKIGQLQDAIEVLETAVSINPGIARAYRNLAELYAEIDNREKALKNAYKVRALAADDTSLITLERDIVPSI